MFSKLTVIGGMTTCNHLNKNRQTKDKVSQDPQTKDTGNKRKHKRRDGYCYSFIQCLVMRTQMSHNQIPVTLRISGKEVQRSWRRLWKEWVKGAVFNSG